MGLLPWYLFIQSSLNACNSSGVAEPSMVEMRDALDDRRVRSSLMCSSVGLVKSARGGRVEPSRTEV